MSAPTLGLRAAAALALPAALLALAAPAGAQVNGINYFKVAYYNQTGPTTQALQAYYFDSALFQQNPTDAKAATLTPGALAPVPYAYTATTGPTNLNINTGAYASQAALDAAFPAGTFKVAYGGGTETQGSFSLTAAPDAFGTTKPLFSAATYTGLQGLNAASAFTLNWNLNTAPAADNDPLDFVTIYNATTGALVYTDGFLAPTVTSVVLPAGALMAGTAYNVGLTFSDRIDGPGTNVTDSNGNGVSVVQAFDLNDSFNFSTAAAAVPEAPAGALLALGLAALLPLGLRAARRRG